MVEVDRSKAAVGVRSVASEHFTFCCSDSSNPNEQLIFLKFYLPYVVLYSSYSCSRYEIYNSLPKL